MPRITHVPPAVNERANGRKVEELACGARRWQCETTVCADSSDNSALHGGEVHQKQNQAAAAPAPLGATGEPVLSSFGRFADNRRRFRRECSEIINWDDTP